MSKYRCRDTGKLLTAKQVRRSRRKVILPTHEERWDAKALRLARVDRVYPTDPPNHNSFLQRVIDAGVEKIDGEYYQQWKLQPRHDTIEDLRRAIILRVRSKARAMRNAGIEVNGIPIKTDSEGVARITGAARGNRPSRKFVVGDQVFDLTGDQVESIFQAVDNYVQGCFDREAALIDEVRASDSPELVDIESGWPGQ